MATFLSLAHDAALATGVASLVYTATVAAAATTAMAARTPARRRAARAVLALLLRNGDEGARVPRRRR